MFNDKIAVVADLFESADQKADGKVPVSDRCRRKKGPVIGRAAVDQVSAVLQMDVDDMILKGLKGQKTVFWRYI